jgi:nucleoside-diphosphate-sugar epimerase
MQTQVFIFGLGYVGKALALHLHKEGIAVSATTRSPATKLWAENHGIQIPGHETIPEILQKATSILITIPPGEGDSWARSFAPHFNPQAWVGYISATSVYGDFKGEWVNEETPCHPDSPRGLERLNAEEAWRQACPNINTFRLTGIYGLGRSVFEQLLTRTALNIHKPGHTFNRIYIEDITQVLLKSMERLDLRQLYNVSDDLPAPTADLIQYACELSGIEPPPLINYEAALAENLISPMLREFYESHRRISNERIKNELGVALICPTYKEGLKRILTL